MEMNLTYQKPIELPSIPTDAIKEVIEDTTLAIGVSVVSKPLLTGVALPQTNVISETMPIFKHSLSHMFKYSLYALLFVLWFMDSTVFLNYEGGLMGFILDLIN